MRTIVKNAVIINEGKSELGSVVIEDDVISDIYYGENQPVVSVDREIDATGCYLLPGIIDDHVHFREPGLTDKADIASESRAAAAGGVTSYFDMPNTQPQTTTLEALDDKFIRASHESMVNYSFFFGATNDNIPLFRQLDSHRIPGIKLFMGSSTGNMLVDRREALERIFASTTLPIMAHCEDTTIINRNMADAQSHYGNDPDVIHHPEIRSEEACYESTRLAVDLARQHGTRLHVAHLTTARELSLFKPAVIGSTKITAEAVVGHLIFSDDDYATLKSLIKVNPAIKKRSDRDALRQALTDGRIAVVGTDHAPHLLKQKQGGCAKAASGMPIIQYSLVSMLELVDQGVLTIERMVELMCHHPALLFEVSRRGFLRRGYFADMVLVRRFPSWKVDKAGILSKCGWSPLEGHTFDWHVEKTFCNGQIVYADGKVAEGGAGGRELRFRE